MPLRITPYHNLKLKHLKNAKFHQDSVFISMPQIEHKSELSGPMELVFSIRLYNMMMSFCDIFLIKSINNNLDNNNSTTSSNTTSSSEISIFCSSRTLRPYKSTSGLSVVIFSVMEKIVGRRVGATTVRKSINTLMRQCYPEYGRETAEMLQHSEHVAKAHYTAAISEQRKVDIGKKIRACLGFDV